MLTPDILTGILFRPSCLAVCLCLSFYHMLPFDGKNDYSPAAWDLFEIYHRIGYYRIRKVEIMVLDGLHY